MDQTGFDFTVQDGLDSIRQTLKGLKLSLQIDKQSSAATAHPLYAVNVLEQKSKVEKSIARVRARLDQWKAWCVADEDPVEIEKNLKRTITWLRDRSGDFNRLQSIRTCLSNCQQIALNHLEQRGSHTLIPSSVSSADAATTHKKNLISALRMAVKRVKDTTWYESPDFEDPALTLLTIATKAFLIDVRLTESGEIHSVDLNINGHDDTFLKEHFRLALVNEKISEFERLLHTLSERSREMNHLCNLFPDANVPDFLSSIENDLSSITRFEQSRMSALDVLQNHHGIIKQYVEGPTTFFYLAPPALALLDDADLTNPDVLSAKLDPQGDGTYSARISLELGPIAGFELSKESSLQISGENIDFKPMAKATAATPPVNCMLILNKPVAMTIQAARRLLRITHSGTVSLGVSKELSLHSESKRFASEGYPLMQLLASTHTIPTTSIVSDSSPFLLDVSFQIDEETFGVPNSAASHQRHYYPKLAQQPSAILIQRIPFVHISQVLPILQIIRQQIVLVELIKSCFNPAILSPIHKASAHNLSRKRKRDDVDGSIDSAIPASASNFRIDVELACNVTPSETELNMIFSCPSVDSSASKRQKTESNGAPSAPTPLGGATSISISINAGGTMSAAVSNSSGQSDAYSDIVTQFLGLTHSVPLSLYHFINMEVNK